MKHTECSGSMMEYGNGTAYACHNCKILQTHKPDGWELRVTR